jgi:hypothetical protein
MFKLFLPTPLVSSNSSYLPLWYLQTPLTYSFGIFKLFLLTPLVFSSFSFIHLEEFEDTKGVSKKNLKITKV